MPSLEEHGAMVWVMALLLLPYISKDEPLLKAEMGFSPVSPFSHWSLLRLPEGSSYRDTYYGDTSGLYAYSIEISWRP